MLFVPDRGPLTHQLQQWFSKWGALGSRRRHPAGIRLRPASLGCTSGLQSQELWGDAPGASLGVLLLRMAENHSREWPQVPLTSFAKDPENAGR